jgi:6-pyruvoyltetrahydropterin/6-carboxytetrahydropterin synthase
MIMSDLYDGTTICKIMTTETAHRLTNYIGKCASIHGHSYKWEVTVGLESRGTKENGIAVDFADLKKAMRECIYDPFDHALVLDENDSLCNSSMLTRDANGQEQKLVKFPGNPTAENFARYVAIQIGTYMDALAEDLEIDTIRVRVWETENSYGQWQEAGPSNF